MANNFLDMVKRKLDAPDQVRLTASDRALLEQTCSGLEEIKKQRESEAEALKELKALIQYNPEVVSGEFEKLQVSIEEALKRVEATQVSTEKAIRISASEEEYKAQKMKKKLSAAIFFGVVSFLTSVGTLTVLLLNIFGII
ncbi:MAG: hypothetical protein E7261_06320 [Lachnospiraceae bacterium]|nr:hypothetical protein [Lachnospiraceae bacterium]